MPTDYKNYLNLLFQMLHKSLTQNLGIKFSNIREDIVGEHHVDARERESRVAVEQVELVFGAGADASGFHEFGLSEGYGQRKSDDGGFF